MEFSRPQSRIIRRLASSTMAMGLIGVLLSNPSLAGSPGDPLWNLPTAEGVAHIKIDAVISKGASTNGNPPILKITVVNIVRGHFAKRQLEVIWTPPPHDIDTGGEDNPRLIAWKKAALLPPKVGTRWISTYYGPNRSYFPGKVPFLGHRYPYTAEKLEWTKKYIADAIAARKKAELERKQRIERVRTEDAAVEKKANLKALFTNATDVVIAKRVSGGMPFMSFMIERRIKDARKQPDAKQKFLEVHATKADEKMITARLTYEYAPKQEHMLLFLRAVPATKNNPPSYLSNVDQRLFEFVDSSNGVLVATQSRLKQLDLLKTKRSSEN